MKTREKFKKWSEENYDQYRINSKKSDYLPSTKAYWKEKERKRREEGKLLEWQQDNPDKIRGYRQDREINKKHELNRIEWEECKKYFNHRCAYCGLAIEDNWRKRKKILKLFDLDKEHVDHDGANDLSNCVPSCGVCNSEKHKFSLEEWYNTNNVKHDDSRNERIHSWLNKDYLIYFKITKFKVLGK